ncbi:MAG TPA: hypothetical protein VFW94_06030 [Candidatus Acidoferrales bacterium]|nr:hypothetical protein [Candidatus Acidoferrales bacterium]
MKIATCLLLSACIVFGLTACVSKSELVSVGPYWNDPVWEKSLVQSINDHVLYPDKATLYFILRGEGTVEFDYRDGKLINPKLVKSTGYDVLDKTIIAGVLKTEPPPIDPAYRKVEHHFQLSLVMIPDPDQFRMILYDKITAKTRLEPSMYPDHPAMVDIHAEYIDGKLSNFTLIRMRGPDGIDKQVERAMESLDLPLPPDYLTHKPIPLRLRVCIAKEYKSCIGDYLGHWMAIRGLSFVMIPP